jgi:hypothetical protein
MRRFVALAAALALCFTACGDDDSARSSDDELASGLTDLILSDSDSDLPLTNEDAACFAVGLIDGLGAERMVTAMDMEFEEFMAQAPQDERREVVDIMLECVDFGAILTAEFETGVSAESSKCLADAFVGSSTFRDALADSFGSSGSDPFDDEDVMTELIPVMFSCLSPEELLELGSDS